ncbi:hypothetical protein [uncultured Kocuria sp.]|nr:hypothetical protein [uncultured Kocuria sp.]
MALKIAIAQKFHIHAMNKPAATGISMVANSVFHPDALDRS